MAEARKQQTEPKEVVKPVEVANPEGAAKPEEAAKTEVDVAKPEGAARNEQAAKPEGTAKSEGAAIALEASKTEGAAMPLEAAKTKGATKPVEVVKFEGTVAKPEEMAKALGAKPKEVTKPVKTYQPQETYKPLGETKPLDVCSTGARPKTDIAARQSRRTEMLTKKLKKKAAKVEMKDDRNYDNIAKVIAIYPIEDKYEFLCERYKLLYQEVRKLETELVRFNQLQVEYEQLNHEFGKALLARSRLENLCRDLQKQNKEIKDETNQKLLEEEERRKQISAKFQASFQELTTLMEESNRKSYKLHDDNVEMTKKIQYLYEKSMETEGQMALMKRECELEKQLYLSNLAKVQLENQMERQQWEKERKILELNLKKSEEVRNQLQVNAKVLQEQVQLYAKKCEDCEKTIKKSNKMFEKCKAETHGVTKKMMSMENDAKTWKKEWLKRDEEAETGKRKIGQLEKLCRQLQAERNEYLKLLRENNIAITLNVNALDNQEPIILPPAPPIASAKERELVVLKNRLAELKDDLQGLNVNAKEEEAVTDGHNGKNQEAESTNDHVDAEKGAEDSM